MDVLAALWLPGASVAVIGVYVAGLVMLRRNFPPEWRSSHFVVTPA